MMRHTGIWSACRKENQRGELTTQSSGNDVTYCVKEEELGHNESLDEHDRACCNDS